MTKLRGMLLAGLFTALMIISSYIVIPIGPVPHTLQPLVVLLSGFVLGPQWGPVSIITWILLGCMGLPVFNQGQGGIIVLLGPTGGFMLGFVVSSWLIGICTWRHPQKGYARSFAVLIMGTLIIYLIGWVGCKYSFDYFLHKPITWKNSAILAIAPFLPFDIIKAAIAAYVGVRVRTALIAAGLYELARD